MAVSISKRMSAMPVSAVRKLAPYAVQAKAEGAHVYHLNIGDPDTKTPDAMLQVLHNWNQNPIRYAPSQGDPAFIQALVQYYHKLGHTVISEQDIITTVGGSEAILMALFAICNAGDSVLVFEPFYSNYSSIASLCDITFIPVPTTIESGFHLPSKETIIQAITPTTRAILFCSPGNPTGTIYTAEEMRLLVDIAKEHDLFLISDEVYREYVFEGAPAQTSLLSFMEEIPDRAIMLDSLSKRYSLCGARLGVFASKNKELITQVIKIAQGRLSGGAVDQAMGAKLTEVPASYIETMRLEYQKRRDTLYNGLSRIPGVTMSRPEGAFYTMVGLPVQNAEDFAIWLLTEYRSKQNETVMLAPGAGFYATSGRGENEVRIAYVLNTDELERCIEIISDALQQYSKRIS